MQSRQKQGKKNRQAGARFERKVRADLESKGWIVSRWSNNVEFEEVEWEENKELGIKKGTKQILTNYGKLVPAKSTRYRSNTHGFPDFVAYTNRFYDAEIRVNGTLEIATISPIDKKTQINEPQDRYAIIGVEVKSNGYLTAEEKEKCQWLLSENIFNHIFIASKGKKRGEIIYEEFEY